MHASGKLLIALCCTSTLVALSGCRTPRADGSVQVTQRPSGAVDPTGAPRTRLAYSNKLATDDSLPSTTRSATSPSSASAPSSASSQGSATASINDDGQSLSVQPASAPQPNSHAVNAQEQQQLMEAFRDADPRIREAARRRMIAGQQANIETKPLLDLDLPTRADLDQELFADSDASSATANQLTAAPAAAPAPENQSQFVMPASHSEPVGESAETMRDAPSLATTAAHVASGGEAAPGGEAAAATPATADEAELTQWSEQKLLAELSKRFAELPEDADDAALLRHHIRYRTMLMLSGRIDEALEPVDGLASSEQEYLRNQLLALWTAVDPQGHPVPQRRWSAALPHLREATSHMAAATGTLEVRSLAFCTEVESFGRITPFESTRFEAGQQVILYSEVDGFAAERLSAGYETQFQGSYEIFDASGKRLHQKVLPADKQVCNNYRRDYFIAYRLHLPSQLAVGKYRLELTMEDLKGEKYGQSSIDFEITGSVSKPHTGS